MHFATLQYYGNKILGFNGLLRMKLISDALVLVYGLFINEKQKVCLNFFCFHSPQMKNVKAVVEQTHLRSCCLDRCTMAIFLWLFS